MGERWTQVRDDLPGPPGEAIAWLRRELHRLGPYFEPVRFDLLPGGLDAFEDVYDTAVVALMQAASLVERPDLVAHAIKAGQLADQAVDKSERILTVAQLAPEIERLLYELGWRLNKTLYGHGTLTDSLKALREAELLPLTPEELEAWDEDERWVGAELAKRRRLTSTSFRAGKEAARLWDRRAQDHLTDASFDRRFPRYLALLELQRLRNAFAHKQSGSLRGLALPAQVWSRVVALTAMICIRAFAAGLLKPAPRAEDRAVTISRSPAPIEPEPLIAYAMPAEPEPLVAHATLEPAPPAHAPGSSPAPTKKRRRRGPPQASAPAPRRRRQRSPPVETPRPRRLRRWLFTTAAATAAVVIGTIGAYVLAPEVVSPAVGNAPQHAPELVTSPSAATDVGSGNEAPTPAAFLAPLAGPPPIPTRNGSSTRQCMLARSSASDDTLPLLSFQSTFEGHGSFRGSVEPRRIGAMMQVREEMGRVVFLTTPVGATRDALLRSIERAACEQRPVLSGAEALAPGENVDAALIVASISGQEDPALPRLLALADTGQAPRLLLAIDAVPKNPPYSMAVLRTEPFDCVRARGALEGRLGLDPGDWAARLKPWALFGGDEQGTTCTTPAALRAPRGVAVVAAALARHEAPPDSFYGTWTSWVDLGFESGTRSAVGDAETRGTDSRINSAGVPREEMVLRLEAFTLAPEKDLRVGPVKRRRRCERWAGESVTRLGELNLVSHLAGTEVGLGCLIWLVEGALGMGGSRDAVLEALDLGLGPSEWRAGALEQAQEDGEHIALTRDAREVLRRLRSPGEAQ